MKTRKLFGLHFANQSFDEAINELVSVAIKDARWRSPRIVVTPNVDHIVKLNRDPQLFSIYSTADYIYADGAPIVLASRILRHPLIERVCGADLFMSLCTRLSESKRKILIIGGRPGEEQLILHRLGQIFPGLIIHIICPSMEFTDNSEESRRTLRLIGEISPDVIFICLGMPKQELWALNNRSSINAHLVLCVGAALDFAIGKIRRAPKAMRRLGMEWLWRVISEPRRLWKRYFVDDLAFLECLAREFFRKG